MADRTRILDGELDGRLAAAGAVVIEGPKACGGTETARQAAASEVLLDVDEQARLAISVDPALVARSSRSAVATRRNASVCASARRRSAPGASRSRAAAGGLKVLAATCR